tara:strand:+ start:1475 stop:1777 length:303 start_codon:yes stop_codon:yes gene_type:complete
MVKVRDPNTGEQIEIDVNMDEFRSDRYEVEREGYTLFVDVTYGSVPSERLYRDRAWLKAAYVSEGRTMADIGKQFAVSPMTIHGWLTKHEIPTRPRGRKS